MIFGSKLLSPKITHYGPGEVLKLGEYVSAWGKGLIVHGESFKKREQFRELKSSKNLSFYLYSGGEPTLQHVRDLLKVARESKYAWIAGIGGGSVLDLAKAAAGLYQAKNDPEFYQIGNPIERIGAPFVAIPTTSGTGAEATVNAVITNESKNQKLSIRDNLFLAEMVILDPELLLGMPAETFIYSALDALVQAIESFFSKNSNWYTRNLALQGFTMIVKNIDNAYETLKQGQDDIGSLKEMLLGSYLTGIAFTNSRLGVIHGLAHPLGVLYNVPHGLVCALCLEPVLKINKPAVYAEYIALSSVAGKDLIKWVSEKLEKFEIFNPFIGKEIIDKTGIIDYTLKSGSTKANPLEINETHVEQLLSDIFLNS